tara:strand:+ start:96000 stop:99437 length:3438 start_codon:yes stop_codon:yes gene_type:complete
MSEEITLGIKLKADGSGLVGELKLSEKELDKLGGSAKDTGRDMNTFSRSSSLAREKLKGLREQSKQLHSTLFSLKGLVATVGIGSLAKSFINAASTAEQYRVRLKILLGDMSEGNRLFQKMSVFASKVPFEYREIMAAATALAGVLAGGVNEISAWMPLIGDLAAASGLGIQQTTDQVIRMMSAGAASADLFRERGILAMLGFQAGVTYSGEQTRDQLIAAWSDVNSKFRDATDELATTWDGKMSMLSDKWFAFRNQVMDAGLFDYLKSLAGAFDKDVGQAMDDNKDKAKEWSDVAISGIENVIRALDVMLAAWNKILIGLKTLELGFETIKFSAISAYNLLPGNKFDSEEERQAAIAGVNKTLSALPEGANDRKLHLKRRAEFESRPLKDFAAQDTSAANMERLKSELDGLINSPDNFDADTKIAEIRDNLKQTSENAKKGSTNVEDLKSKVDALNNSKVENNQLSDEELKDIDDLLKAGDKAAKQQKKEIAARKKALQDRVADLSDSLLDETELENKRYKESVTLLKKAEEQKLATTMSYAELRQRLEDEHQVNLKDIRDKAGEEERNRLEDEAKKQAEIMQEPFKNALRGIQDGFTDFYEDLFSGGVDSFSDLASSAKKIFIRLAAEIATLMTIRPVISGVLGSIGLGGVASSLGFGGGGSLSGLAGGAVSGVAGGSGGGILSSVAGIGSSLIGNISSILSGVGSPSLGILGANIGDFLGLGGSASTTLGLGLQYSPYGGIGSLAANLFGLGGGGIVGTGLSTIGSIAGGAFGGPIGAGIGGFLGSALGGLFGGGGTPSIGGASVDSLVNGSVSLHGADPQGAQQLNQAIAKTVLNFANSVGGNVRDENILTNHLSNYSDHPGRFQFVTGAGGKGIEGNDAQDVATRAVTAIIENGGITGLSSALSGALQKSASNNRTDIEAIFNDLQFAAGLLGESLTGDGGTSAALSEINNQFNEMRERAESLGLPLNTINDALSDQLATLEVSLTDKLRSISRTADQVLGIDALTAFRSNLQTSELSGLSASDRLSASRSRLEETSNLALAGDADAIRLFPALAQQTLGLGRDVFASGSGFQDLFKSVNETLNKVIDRQENIRGDFGSDLDVAIRDTSAETIAALEKEFDETRNALEEIRIELGKAKAA